MALLHLCCHSLRGAATCSFAARTRPRTMSKRANSKPVNGHGQVDVDFWPNWYGWSWSAAPAPSLLPSVDGVCSCSAISISSPSYSDETMTDRAVQPVDEPL